MLKPQRSPLTAEILDILVPGHAKMTMVGGASQLYLGKATLGDTLYVLHRKLDDIKEDIQLMPAADAYNAFTVVSVSDMWGCGDQDQFYVLENFTPLKDIEDNGITGTIWLGDNLHLVWTENGHKGGYDALLYDTRTGVEHTLYRRHATVSALYDGMRHMYWGPDGFGYVYYPDAAAYIYAFHILSELDRRHTGTYGMADAHNWVGPESIAKCVTAAIDATDTVNLSDYV